jgi:hypothetical protein
MGPEILPYRLITDPHRIETRLTDRLRGQSPMLCTMISKLKRISTVLNLMKQLLMMTRLPMKVIRLLLIMH